MSVILLKILSMICSCPVKNSFSIIKCGKETLNLVVDLETILFLSDWLCPKAAETKINMGTLKFHVVKVMTANAKITETTRNHQFVTP